MNASQNRLPPRRPIRRSYALHRPASFCTAVRCYKLAATQLYCGAYNKAVGCPEARLSHPRIQRSYALYPPGVCDRLGCILPLPPSETRTFVGLDDECLESFCKAEGRANELRLDSTLRASNNYAYGVLLRQPVCAVPQGARDYPEPRASCCPSPHSQQRREGSTALLALLCEISWATQRRTGRRSRAQRTSSTRRTTPGPSL